MAASSPTAGGSVGSAIAAPLSWHTGWGGWDAALDQQTPPARRSPYRPDVHVVATVGHRPPGRPPASTRSGRGSARSVRGVADCRCRYDDGGERMAVWVARHRLLVALSVLVVVIVAGLRVASIAAARSCADTPPAEAFVTVDGVALHHVDRGAGHPVVLLHGDGGSVLDLTMSPAVDRLAERHRVIVIDRPGHGHSDPAREVGSLREQASLVRGAVRQLGLEDPVLVGHSRGATVMAAYLDAFADEVAAAVSLGGDLLGNPDPGDYGAYRPVSWPVLGPAVVDVFYAPAVRAGDHRLLRDGLDRAFAPEGPAPDDYVAAYACRWVSVDALEATYRLMEDTGVVMPEVRRGYSDVTVPVLIVHGSADGNVPLADAVEAHQLLPTSELRVLDGAGHELQFTRPDDVIRAIDDAVSLTRR
ncbi:MAG: alpha/beta hydrolase [Nitriliruptor sp.]|nr:MAG: alpha/beta hydrolase [Nitriliruptor sp.]